APSHIRGSGPAPRRESRDGRGKGKGQRAKVRKGYREKGKGTGRSALRLRLGPPRHVYSPGPRRSAGSQVVEAPRRSRRGRRSFSLTLFPATFASLCPLPCALSPSVRRGTIECLA